MLIAKNFFELKINVGTSFGRDTRNSFCSAPEVKYSFHENGFFSDITRFRCFNVRSVQKNQPVLRRKRKMEDVSIKLKIIVVGDAAVGKTSLTKRWVDNTFGDNAATVEGDYVTKKCD